MSNAQRPVNSNRTSRSDDVPSELSSTIDGGEAPDEEQELLSRRGRFSRDKGARGERAFVRRFKAVFGESQVRRGHQYRDGTECPDIIAPNLWVEVKCGKKPNPRAALAQAIKASEGHHRWPVAVVRDDRAEPFVVMSLEDFEDLLTEWWAGRQA